MPRSPAHLLGAGMALGPRPGEGPGRFQAPYQIVEGDCETVSALTSSIKPRVSGDRSVPDRGMDGTPQVKDQEEARVLGN